MEKQKKRPLQISYMAPLRFGRRPTKGEQKKRLYSSITESFHVEA